MHVTLGIVRSTALYVFLSLPTCIWLFGVGFADATSAAANPVTFADWFLYLGFLALPVLLFTLVFSALWVLVARRVFPVRYRTFSVVDIVVGGLGYAFKNAFDGLRFLVYGLETDETGIHRLLSHAFRIFHFCWAVALVVYLAAGFLAVS